MPVFIPEPFIYKSNAQIQSSKLEIKDKTKDIKTLTYFVQTLAYFGLATSCFCNVLGDGEDVCAESLRHDYGCDSGSSDGCDDYHSRNLVVVILAIVVLVVIAMVMMVEIYL